MSKSRDKTSYIPVKGRKRKVNQQGTTLVSRARHTEIAALHETIGILDGLVYGGPDRGLITLEAAKWRAVWEANAEAERLCQRGHHLYGASRLSWISGHTGILYSEVKFILRK